MPLTWGILRPVGPLLPEGAASMGRRRGCAACCFTSCVHVRRLDLLAQAVAQAAWLPLLVSMARLA